MGESVAEDKYRAPALTKGLDILELLASANDGLSLSEIGKQLGRTTPEIFRMLMVLRQRGYVALGDDGRYHLTTKLFEVAHRHPIIRRLTAIAGDEMQKAANRINQCIHLCILHSGRLLVVAQVDCPDANVNTVRLGAQIPIEYSASGRVLAAFMREDELASLLVLAGSDAARSGRRFAADLPEIRKNGYFQAKSLTIEGVTNISAPVFDFTGKAVAAMTTPFIHRLTGSAHPTVDEAREILVQTCSELSRRMGSGAAAEG